MKDLCKSSVKTVSMDDWIGNTVNYLIETCPVTFEKQVISKEQLYMVIRNQRINYFETNPSIQDFLTIMSGKGSSLMVFFKRELDERLS